LVVVKKVLRDIINLAIQFFNLSEENILIGMDFLMDIKALPGGSAFA